MAGRAEERIRTIPRRAAIYARVSTQRQQRQATIDSQVCALRARVSDDDHQLADQHIILDDGYSGSYLDRPGLDRVRDLARDGAIDLIYVHSPDRLARRYAHQVILIEELEQLGCEVIFLNHAPSDDPEGQLLVQIQGVIAEYERAKMAERTRRGKLHRARQGAVVSWKAPYGYRYARSHRDEPGRWEVNEGEAPMIQTLFGWVVNEGISVRQATQRLNTSPWRPRGGRDLWCTSSVRAILTNDAYIGIAYYNRRRWIESDRTDAMFRKTRKTRSVLRPRQEWIAIPIPPLIDHDTFVRAQEQLKKNKAFSRRNLRREGEYLLRCLVTCGVCGQSMVAHSHGRHTYYHRSGSVDHVRTGRPMRCPAPQVYAPDLDHLVWEEIKTLLKSPQLTRESWQRQHERAGFDRSDLAEAQLVRLDQRIADARRQIQRLIDGYQAGLIRRGELGKRRASLEGRIAHWTTERNRLEADRPRWRDMKAVWESLSSFSSQIATTLDTLGFDDKQKLLRKVIERVYITAWDVKVKLVIPLSTKLDLTTLRVCDAEDAAAVLPMPNSA